MLFNSYLYIFLFLPLVIIGYYLLSYYNLRTLSRLFLVISSLTFYSYWNIKYLPLIVGSLTFNYLLALLMERHTDHLKKVLLLVGVGANIVLLGYFKYTDFLIENLNLLTDQNYPSINIILPLAISFFTFQQIAYLVDSYRKEISEHSFLSYCLFVTFFPQLIAGPIVHHKEMMPQFHKNNKFFFEWNNIYAGLFIFSIGLFKKVVVADSFAIWANVGFDTNVDLNLLEAWGTSLSYTFQLYFDFSGYADMAVGSALMFNIKLPVNFNSPYKSINIQEFWRRWHITLSKFLRDYIYIPLGGNRKNNIFTSRNIIITFLIGGIWHGAGWTFVFWGGCMGVHWSFTGCGAALI